MDELTFTVTTVLAALLSEASQDTYAKARDVIRRAVRRGDRRETGVVLERLDEDRARVERCPAAYRDEEARSAAAARAPALEELMRGDPVAFAELRALTGADRPTSVINQHNHGQGTFINGNVQGGLTIHHGATHGREA
ncbi:hypothetical protein AB0C13_10920 [Streptomyces sp. NPDC049099]|uniref:hypothetical protein n=1 Tax=Streptomyces sp. NPDC049099 TaxID=3155768 RepID=UPI00341A8951